MKRYFLFGGDTYYPAGGWDDLIGACDSVAECLAVWQMHQLSLLSESVAYDYPFCHVIDSENWRIVYRELDGDCEIRGDFVPEGDE